MKTTSAVQIEVHLYAQLREQAGLETTQVTTAAASVADLYEELRRKFDFSLRAESMRVALNDSFCSWNDRLQNGDRVTFVPPVAGG